MWLGHNLPTTNAKPIRGSKYGDFHLVFFWKKKQKTPSCGWGPGPDEVGQNDINLPSLQRHLKKLKSKILF